jgi:hypothetical protein
MKIDTRTIENFLSEEEVNYFWTFYHNEPNKQPDYSKINPGQLDSTLTHIRWSPDTKAYNILKPKLDKHFGPRLIVNKIHILDSYSPYRIHTDGGGNGAFGNSVNTPPAWTIIIPLADFDSHTILFNEESDDIRTTMEWITANNRRPINKISEEFKAKYLSDDSSELLSYFSVEEVFKWKKGVCFAASRNKFHASDNFPARGLKNKVGIIMWTTYAAEA